jgi:hypothetical protein
MKSCTSKKIEQKKNQLRKYFQYERCHKHAYRKDQEHVNQTCENAHSNQHHIAEIESRLYLNLSTRATSFKVKQSFTLMTPVLSTLPFLSFIKVAYSLCDRGVRLENHFLFPVMCCEQPESMSHVSSKPPSITYTGREKVVDSVLGLVR